MRTDAFRIKCKLTGGDFGTNEREFPLALPALIPPIIVSLPERGSPTEDQFLILQGGGFTSEEEARAAGGRVKTAVMLAGVLLGFGIDVGTDQVISPAGHRKDGQPDEHLQPDVHGLQVVPEIEGRMLFGFIWRCPSKPHCSWQGFPYTFLYESSQHLLANFWGFARYPRMSLWHTLATIEQY
jgi:hypothetical protein